MDAGDEAVSEVDVLVVLVRSRVLAPETRCCWRVASAAELPGAVVPKAQIICCFVSEFA